MITGLSYWRFYFRMFNGSIKSPQIVEFLKALQATIGKKLLIIWDRLQAHRSKLVRAHVEAQNGHIMIDYLPAYAGYGRVINTASVHGLVAEKQPSRRLSSPAEIARLACWLCAPEAHNITGTAIPIDGGWTAQ